MRESISKKNYTEKVRIKASAEKIFLALTQQIDEWWGQVEGDSSKLNETFVVSWGEPWYQFKIKEFVNDKRIVWECTDANQVIDGLEGVEKEWVGNLLYWQIEKSDDNISVDLSLTQVGLTPAEICYDVCSSAWTGFIGSGLKSFLEEKR